MLTAINNLKLNSTNRHMLLCVRILMELCWVMGLRRLPVLPHSASADLAGDPSSAPAEAAQAGASFKLLGFAACISQASCLDHV